MNPLFKIGNVVRVDWDRRQGYVVTSLLETTGKDYPDGFSYEVEGIWSKKRSWTNSPSMSLVMRSRHFFSETTIEEFTTLIAYENRKVVIDYNDGNPKETIDLPTYDWLWLTRNNWSKKDIMKFEKSLSRIEAKNEKYKWEQLSLF